MEWLNVLAFGSGKRHPLLDKVLCGLVGDGVVRLLDEWSNVLEHVGQI